MSPPDDPFAFERLRDLPAPTPLDDLGVERVRRRAHAALLVERRFAQWPALGMARRVWSGAVVPALLATTVCVYFGWAVRAAAALYR